MRRLISATAVAAALWIPLSGRSSDAPIDAAAVAWDRGDYVAALTTYLQVLDSAGADEALETIALQTGELFHTRELTTDGESPKFSLDGRYIAYQTGALRARAIRLLAAADPTKEVATLSGFRGVFSPDSNRFAYLRVTSTPALQEAAASVEVGPSNQRAQRLTAFNSRIALESRLVVREIASGRETEMETGQLRKQSLAFGATGILFAGSPADGSGQIYWIQNGAAPAALTSGDGEKVIGDMNASGTALTFTVRLAGAGRAGGGGGGQGANQSFRLLTLPDGKVATIAGSAPAFSVDGGSIAYLARAANETRLMVAAVNDPSAAAAIRSGPERLDAPAFSPDGKRLAFQITPKEDWEIHLIGRDGTGETRLTRDIQHDLLPRFLDNDRLVGMIGEARHRRSFLYDLATGKRTRLFHNNTIRTIAPEYSWVPSPDGQKLLIVAERDGDTVSAERGVYLVDLSRRVTRDELRARLRSNLAAEQALREKTQRQFATIAANVRQVVGQASVARIFGYEKALFDFDSKHITRPGNRLASEYLFNTYKSFGYEPEYQWFAGRGALGGQTANVLATLRGTRNPELVYVVSSHYDSVAIGPGADDDTSGTAALLETARILAKQPQPATIVFASFTGEEAGLLGSREYVRRAVAAKVHIVGALNNDMVGWANDHRLDNTIRYSNAGIRDIQHGAAMHFTSLITYDALYYKSTDAAAYYEAYGDIVGGIGSYPVLGNPHYHQSHDLLDTINHQLVTEVAKTTAATLMLMASSPSRLTDLRVESFSKGTATISWTPSPETGVSGYVVAYGPANNPEAHRTKTSGPQATVSKVQPGMVISVKAVNDKGLEGWDWTRVTLK
ncbi:MAG: M20/M25/M40 family metallo-hydrolase [Acidobacteria bacterium]|nr:M20/M25/M40 family metallo-hydrolase [Acidobacteriota bacterium]